MRGRHPLWLAILASAGLLVGAGCDNELAPDLPADYQPIIGRAVYSCDRWPDGVFLQDALLVDLHVLWVGGWEYHDQPPMQSQIDSVIAHGGEIIHVYNFPAMRIRVRASDLPSVALAAGHALATDVPDSTHFDWTFTVLYRDVFTTTDSLRLVALHGRVISVDRLTAAVNVELPESSVTLLRQNVSRVWGIDPALWACPPTD